jgi:hypothetical protein
MQMKKNIKFIGSKHCENRNDPDLVQAFLKKWWVESENRAVCNKTITTLELDQYL